MADEFLRAQLENRLTGAPASVVDVRDRMAAFSRPRACRTQAAFPAVRRNRAPPNPRPTSEEKASLQARFQAASASDAPSPDPVPGLPGYGFDYAPAFNVAYANGTAITHTAPIASSQGCHSHVR